jgi:hypothetical protein
MAIQVFALRKVPNLRLRVGISLSIPTVPKLLQPENLDQLACNAVFVAVPRDRVGG